MITPQGNSKEHYLATAMLLGKYYAHEIKAFYDDVSTTAIGLTYYDRDTLEVLAEDEIRRRIDASYSLETLNYDGE